MDLQAGAIAIAALLIFFAFLSTRAGIRTIQAARRMTFYHLRRQREVVGWRRLGIAVVLLLAAAAMPVFALPVAYQYFPPSPTPSLTPTVTIVPSITVSPTITLSPTVTDTPVESATPTLTATPHIPEPIQALFESTVTPNPDVIFAPLEFTTAGGGYPPTRPNTVFQNPVGHMFGVFTYDGMFPGVQWTALWLHNGELVSFESYPWNGGTGGAYFTEWNPPPAEWQPGIYTVQLFVGQEFIISGRFLVEGPPPTAESTSSLTSTPVSAPGPGGSATLSPTAQSPATPGTSTP